ncbi:RNA polymerase sigma factor [Fimbriiglobus ruber]|uniref:RNA polymerase sigma-70 factor, ECF subfamily n=1 Tax=Fimbriiglobus ruber TaxID=1908690 RepID=A0A225DEL7_9BACT|nr:sigma-70 family RNA polymerase sigma factor [Fimbriiglobus ruber]OWK38094.1 RNA polymerase sigma-70 factor, ECF subfamily [Fimbriiglobus ruber]
MFPNNDPYALYSDEDLLTRLRDGERDLFGGLVKRYERELFGYLRRYLGDDDLAADVFQNTFVQVFVKIAQYQPGRPARPWLYAIATNQAIDALRRRNRRVDGKADPLLAGDAADDSARPLFEILEDHNPGPVARAEGAELRQLVRDAVDRLPDLLRQVVVLAYFQGLRYQEIADALDIPLGTVKSRLHAALAKLTEAWHGTAEATPDE